MPTFHHITLWAWFNYRVQKIFWLTTKYDDKIIELTGNWKLTNDIVRKIGGDKTAISNALKILELIGYLQTKPDKNKLI